MFKRKATAAEKAEADTEEVTILAFVMMAGGYHTTTDEHQGNRARMVLAATDNADYQRLAMVSLPTKRREFNYMTATYSKDKAKKIMEREVNMEEEGEESQVPIIYSIVAKEETVLGKRVVTMTGTFLAEVQNAWEKEKNKIKEEVHEYTIMIFEHDPEVVKNLDHLKHWDWEPLTLKQVDLEIEALEPRCINNFQKLGVREILAMTTTWSIASNMLPAAAAIKLPASIEEVALTPDPAEGNIAGMWEVSLRGYSVISKTIVDSEKNKKDLPFGVNVSIRLTYTGDQDPTPAEMPLLPLWSICPEWIAMDAKGGWTAATEAKEGDEGAFPYPKTQKSFFVAQEDPNEMNWIMLRYRTPGLNTGRPALLDTMYDDCQQGEYYALGGLAVATAWNQGREAAHLARHMGRAARPRSHQNKKAKQQGLGEETPLGFPAKSTTTPHHLTRKLQEEWKPAIEAKYTKEQQAKAPPCWMVANRALQTGETKNSMMIQLALDGELVQRNEEQFGLLPIIVIDNRCKGAECKKEPCVTAEKQARLPSFHQKKSEKMNDPGLTQPAASQNASAGGDASAFAEPMQPDHSMAGGKRSEMSSTGGNQKKAASGSPFSRPPGSSQQAQAAPTSPIRQVSFNVGAAPYRPNPTYPASFGVPAMPPQGMAGATMMPQGCGPPQGFMPPQGYMPQQAYMPMYQTMREGGAYMIPGQSSQPSSSQQSGSQQSSDQNADEGEYAATQQLNQPMSVSEQVDFKKHVSELYRVTPDYKVVLTVSGTTPWADLTFTGAPSPIRKMKDLFDSGDLRWNEPYWIRDLGHLLIKHEAINHMNQLSEILEACLHMGVVKSLDATKCKLSFTKTLIMKLSPGLRGRGRSLGGGRGRLYNASTSSKGKGKGKGKN